MGRSNLVTTLQEEAGDICVEGGGAGKQCSYRKHKGERETRPSLGYPTKKTSSASASVVPGMEWSSLRPHSLVSSATIGESMVTESIKAKNSKPTLPVIAADVHKQSPRRPPTS